MRFKILFALCVSMVFSYGGAAFESDSYLIWISSRCPEQSTTCTSVTYNQTSKSNGKTIVIEGGEPIVGSLSKNLIGYTFYDLQTKHSYELSMDLDGFYMLYIRRDPKPSTTETVKRISDNDYQAKLAKIRK